MGNKRRKEKNEAEKSVRELNDSHKNVFIVRLKPANRTSNNGIDRMTQKQLKN